MKTQKLKALKAFFLLIVFCMSTVVSFACAMGLEMGYNKNHHQAAIKILSCCKHKTVKDGKNQISTRQSSNKADDDCCKKEAKKFAKFDKIVVKSSVDTQQPIFLLSFIQTFYSFDLYKATQLASFTSNLYRKHHPPIPDTRIAIQSFLI